MAFIGVYGCWVVKVDLLVSGCGWYCLYGIWVLKVILFGGELGKWFIILWSKRGLIFIRIIAFILTESEDACLIEYFNLLRLKWNGCVFRLLKTFGPLVSNKILLYCIKSGSIMVCHALLCLIPLQFETLPGRKYLRKRKFCIWVIFKDKEFQFP